RSNSSILARAAGLPSAALPSEYDRLDRNRLDAAGDDRDDHRAWRIGRPSHHHRRNCSRCPESYREEQRYPDIASIAVKFGHTTGNALEDTTRDEELEGQDQ